MQLSIPKQNILISFILFLTLLPVQNLLGFDIPVVYTLMIFLVFLLLLIPMRKVNITKFPKFIMLLFLLIILEIILSTYVSTIRHFNEFYFPNDIIHYFARLLMFIYFVIKLYNIKIKATFFIKVFLITLTLGMSIGLLQWLPWPGNVYFLKMYPFKDGSLQLSLIGKELSFVRIHGWAQHATANGGLAMLSFVFAISNYLYGKAFKKLSILLMVFSIVNIIISQARAGLLALLFSILFMYLIHLVISRKKIISSLKYIVILFLSALFIRLLYVNNNPYIERIIFRWNALFESSGGARVNQMEYALSLINTPMDFLLGISRAVQSNSFNYYHIESEPVNTFVLTGFIGFLLHYGLVLILFLYFFRNIRRFKSSNNKNLVVLLTSSIVILASYQVFSVAFFFFREARVGLIPWILMGATVGYVELQKKLSFKDYKEKS